MSTYRGRTDVISRSAAVSDAVVRTLQRDLRGLGYLHDGIDGKRGAGLDHAVRAIRIDLCNPALSPVIATANADGMVAAAPASGDAAVEPALADCIGRLVDDPAIVKLPASADAVADNRRIMAAFRAIRSNRVPIPFLAAMFRQESGGRHFAQPTANNSDAFVVIGLDRNDGGRPERVTSRGYGLGQFTIFHHPPTAAERTAFIDDPVDNVQSAIAEFRSKFDSAVHAKGSSEGADDFRVEHPLRKPSLCRYASDDPRTPVVAGSALRCAGPHPHLSRSGV